MKKIILTLSFILGIGIINSYAIMPSSNNPQAVVVVEPDANDTYVCYANVGTATTTAAWQCSYVHVVSTTTTVTWANGNANFTNPANNPASLSYS